jgi:antitoxin (DNA-binding transcriptional repressor) of toxin-antitoxin stability system
MACVCVSHLRRHLFPYLKRVQEAECIQITSRGRVIARLEGLQGCVTLGDVVSPLGPEVADAAWTGDADHL